MTKGLISYWRADIIKIRGLINQLFNYIQRSKANELIKRDAVKIASEIDRRFSKGRSKDATQNPHQPT